MEYIEVMTNSVAATSERANSVEPDEQSSSSALDNAPGLGDGNGGGSGDDHKESYSEDEKGMQRKDEQPTINFGGPNMEFFFLSNSFPAHIMLDGILYPNAEALFQTSKFGNHPKLQAALMKTDGPADHIAKGQAWAEDITDDWMSQRLQVMREVLLLKFTQHRQLHARLLQTGKTRLVYNSKVGDFWSASPHGGDNNLGKLLMELRDSFTPEVGPLLGSIALNAIAQSGAVSSSVVWCAGGADKEKWYPTSSTVLRKVTTWPSIATANASEDCFVHNIYHSEQHAFNLVVVLQERGDTKVTLTITRPGEGGSVGAIDLGSKEVKTTIRDSVDDATYRTDSLRLRYAMFAVSAIRSEKFGLSFNFQHAKGGTISRSYTVETLVS